MMYLIRCLLWPVCCYPLMLFLTRTITKRTRVLFLEQQSSLGDLNGLIEETLSGQKVIKVFNREAACLEEFNQQNTRLRKVSTRAQILSGVVGPVMNLLNNLSFALVVMVGGLLVIKGIISVGVVVSFISYIRFFNRPLNELANQFNMIQSALAGAERVFAILDEPAESEDGQITIEPAKVKGKLFSHVSFAYKGEPVLKEINFSAKPGQVIALIGPTGRVRHHHQSALPFL